MTNSKLWRQAWELAQPQIQSAQNVLTGPSPVQRVLRAGQLDAELLDQELAHLLQGPLSSALGLIHSSLKHRFEPELALIIQLALYRLSVCETGASYGAELQGLRYSPGPLKGLLKFNLVCGLSARQLAVHSALTIVGPHVHTRMRGHALAHAWPDAPTSDIRRQAWDVLAKLETGYAALALASFVAFLWDGRYRTLADRLLGMKLVPATRLVKREVSYEFMNRQMVWHAFTEFLLFVLPLLPRRALQRSASAAVDAVSQPVATLASMLPSSVRDALELSPRVVTDAAGQQRGLYWHLSDTECAICHENAALILSVSSPSETSNIYLSQSAAMRVSDSGKERPTHPLTTPYRTSCNHVYCYACVADRMLRAADEGSSPWTCLRCTEPVYSVERVLAEPLYWISDGEEDGRSTLDWGSDYFDELGSSSVSGVSGMSIGSRSWSDGERSD
ncbi:Pex12 amino terminal region-domain-containing protein [Vararia minispora EC-137]|uniref:Pex12 amino terminal region-domain-containing protein n=1 Tax=Vararia minispora EC-137 TaxID=1314806 RepID=A0ACB8QHD3_9AGAM|nr:Pex12 amino terminal region-domain-containing protein [Vararia minispora EC-137]